MYEELGPCREYRGYRTNNYGRLYRPSEKRCVQLHRWIVEQVEGRSLRSDEVVMHLCDNPPCFRLSHLRIGSQSDNMRDCRDKGRLAVGGDRDWARGDRLPHTVLTEDQVKEIRMRVAGGETKSSLAREFGVHRNTVSDIVFRRNWKWVA